MKNKIILVLILAFLSLLSGILISKMSLLSKVGITFIYDEFSLLKSWWKTGLALFIVQMMLFSILGLIQNQKASMLRYYGFPLLFIILGLIGCYLTYLDFTETSHRLMNSSFKIGFYIFWITWLINCFSFLKKRNSLQELEIIEETAFSNSINERIHENT